MASPNLTKVTENLVDFEVASISRTCQTWYKLFGILEPGVRPLIALHGGPGINSTYLEILSDLIAGTGSGALIVYDQIGNGKSTHIPEKMGDTNFWTVQLFLDELNNLLAKLNIKEYDLFGHSWGGILGASHALAQPSGLKHLILASTPSSMEIWDQAQNELKGKLPQEIREVLEKNEKAGTTQSPEYQGAMGAFFGRHLCTVHPMPEAVMKGLQTVAEDPTVTLSMIGPSQFGVKGSLEGWSIIDQLDKIRVPTLVINGANDTATDAVVAPYVEKVSNAKWVKFQNSSHMCHYEEREEFMRVVGNFLRDI